MPEFGNPHPQSQLRFCRGFTRVCKVLLDPEEPTFLGFLTMNSVYKTLKKVGYLGLRLLGLNHPRIGRLTPSRPSPPPFPSPLQHYASCRDGPLEGLSGTLITYIFMG